MILYFSGTGNSAYAAKRIGKILGTAPCDLLEKIRANDHSTVHSRTPWVLVTPTYAWRIPRIVQAWLEQTELSGNREIYFVLTCGDSIGDAGAYLEKWCRKKGMEDRGCIPVVMPENYIALFPTPSPEEALPIVEKAEPVIDRAARMIQKGERFPRAKITLKDRLSSGIVNDLFYPLFVHAKKFDVTDACISCGRCVAVCPLHNIRLAEGKPVWGKACTHCMACICRCPCGAIAYGTSSKGRPRYLCPKTETEE